MRRVITLAKAENRRKNLLLVLALVMVNLGGSAAFALDPMGPPVAGLLKGELKGQADYSRSTMDLKLSEGKGVVYIDGVFQASWQEPSVTIKDFKINKGYVGLGYGVSLNCEAFLRMGATSSKFGDSLWEEGEKFDGSTDFTLGGGLKATFYERENLKIGGVFQANWAKFDGKLEVPTVAADDLIGIDLMEMQIAIGAIRTWTERVSIYGGPFVHLVNGDFDYAFSRAEGGLQTFKYSWDIKEGLTYGGYIGARLKLAEDWSFDIEYQHTEDANLFGASLMLRY